MRKIDFLSQSPNNFIFHKESNKTTIGGVLSSIFLIISLLIFFYFITIYSLSEPYVISSFSIGERVIPEEDESKFAESEKYNPIIPMKFSLHDQLGNNLSDSFILVDYLRHTIIERDTIIKRRVDDIHIDILYKCNNDSETNKTTCEVESKDLHMIYTLKVHYQGFNYEPQEEIPIKQLPDNIFNEIEFVFNSDVKLRTIFRWVITRYEDNKGFIQLFDIFKEKEGNNNIKENDIFIGGEFEEYNTMIINKETFYRRMYNTRLMLILDSLGIKNRNAILYKDFKRKGKSILVCFANIFSLWISLYHFFISLFALLYSKSFDKYKIVDNILYQNLMKNKNQINLQEKNIEYNIGDILLENDSEKEMKDKKLLNNINSSINDDINNINDFIKNEGREKRILPRLKFFDFIFNSFYSKKCCCINKKQEIISECKNIILEYYSIENILYNQIMLENLFKDYKWNNPELNNIQNNKMIIKLKNNWIGLNI